MSSTRSHFGRWLVPCTVVGVLLGGAPLTLRADDNPRVWLEKMNQALATRNYDGTFFHLSDGRVETMRIVHRFQGGRTTERLQSLDGSGREFVRNNNELTCYLPDKRTILVEGGKEGGSFLGALPQFEKGMEEFYRIESLPDARVLGRPVRVIAVNPKDQYRFGYRLWLDAKTAMPLKTQLCDSGGNIIEQIQFAHLEMPQTIADGELVPSVPTEGMRWVRQGPRDTAAAALSGFRASQLPPGFRLTVAGAQSIGGGAEPAAHLVYSDGLATVSVFVEAGTADKPIPVDKAAARPPEPPMEGLARVGSGFAFSTVVQGHQVTAVGEVPAETVEFIAHGVRPDASAGLPRH
jgi:sigma-E factor negative regulatory protein RseB